MLFKCSYSDIYYTYCECLQLHAIVSCAVFFLCVYVPLSNHNSPVQYRHCNNNRVDLNSWYYRG